MECNSILRDCYINTAATLLHNREKLLQQQQNLQEQLKILELAISDYEIKLNIIRDKGLAVSQKMGLIDFDEQVATSYEKKCLIGELFY